MNIKHGPKIPGQVSECEMFRSDYLSCSAAPKGFGDWPAKRILIVRSCSREISSGDDAISLSRVNSRSMLAVGVVRK